MGTNVLLGLAPERIAEVPTLLAAGAGKEAHVPPLWDGKASERIADVLAGYPLEERAVAKTR
jgi:UDP-N-acetylglucosamine 2-epimerase (non-hydrolysing)